MEIKDKQELVKQLKVALAEESSKDEYEIDPKKIKYLVRLLDAYEGTQSISDPQNKLKQFQNQYQMKPYRHRLYVRKITAVAAVSILLFVTITVQAAYPQKIFEIIQNMGNFSIQSKKERDDIEIVQNRTEYYDSWNVLARLTPYELLIPNYIPDRFKQGKIQVTDYQDGRSQINCNYDNGDETEEYIHFMMRTYPNVDVNLSYRDEREWTYINTNFIQGRETLYYQYEGEEEVLLKAIFEYGRTFYSIEGEVTLDELNNILYGMRLDL